MTILTILKNCRIIFMGEEYLLSSFIVYIFHKEKWTGKSSPC